MRSSIACIRCRRSKVKCVNNGVGTTCRSCENSGRECSYPSPIAGGSRRREGSFSGRNSGGYGDADAERRQRPRKNTHTFVANPQVTSRESPRPMLDALDPRLLTPIVWQELFDIFQTHYSADLPFLHPPTFLKPLRQATMKPPGLAPSSDTHENARPPGSELFLLAFLALTARFHPKIVAHHSPSSATRASNPLIASEYYAAAAHQRLSQMWTEDPAYGIERTQATLFLGLHEWGMCRGAKAWLIVGLATRAAQAMGLQYEMDLDDEPFSRTMAVKCEAEKVLSEHGRKNPKGEPRTDEEMFIEQEIRRRTFWSCYIMDRYLSSGKYRPQMLHARELRIQLPASERSFLFAEKVRTLMLGEEDSNVAGRAEVQSHRQQSVLLGTGGTPERNTVPPPKFLSTSEDEQEKGRLEIGADEGLVSRYIKMLEIFGEVIKWSCAGGRRLEEHPPWDPRCEWNKLMRSCQEFKASLPRQHTLTPQNTQAHISLKASTPYMLVHTVYLLCQIMLHREYTPFIPLRCSKPEGPLDPPLFPKEKYDIPPGFWRDSARECFKAARDIMDLVRTCQEWNAFVETPIVGFAVYIVAFVGVYCINFPWMDPDGYMCTQPSCASNNASQTASTQAGVNGAGGSKGFEAARKALEMIGQMRPRLHMADGWFKTINRTHKYFRRYKSDYRKNVQDTAQSGSEESPLSTRHLSLRDGGIGGGLDEFKLLERTLQEFGTLEDQDIEMTDGNSRPGSRPLDAVYDDSNSGTTVKSEEGDNRGLSEQSRAEGGPWNAINTAPGATQARSSTMSTPTTTAQFRSYDAHSQQPTPNSAPPLQHSQQQPQQQQHSQPNYAHQLNSFRPSYQSPHDAQGHTPGPGAPPSLTSPASHTASTPSQPSPPFEHHQQGYNQWAAQTGQQHGYSMQPPPHAYANGTPTGYQQPHQHPHSHAATPMQQLPPYIPPGQHPQAQQQMQPAPQMQEPPQVWDHMAKEAWLNGLDTRLGGDDVAAFVDGGEMAEWASMAASRGFGGGWLSAVWGGAQS